MPERLKLPWALTTNTDPGCAACAAKGARGEEVRNADGEVIFSSGHDTYYFDEFDLRTIVDAVNKYAREVEQVRN